MGALRLKAEDGDQFEREVAAHYSARETIENIPANTSVQSTAGTVWDIPAPWNELLQTYARHSDVAGAHISVLRLMKGNPEAVASALMERAAQLRAGDVLALEIGGKTRRFPDRMTREELGRALFLAGFENTLVWAGRAVLIAETRHARVLGALLPSSALGAGELRIPGVSGRLIPPSDRILCLARRSSLPKPAERRLKLSVVLPVYNERSTFCDLMERLLAKQMDGIDMEICLVESNSTDGTRDDVLSYRDEPRVRLLLEDKPSGKGHAVRKGLAMATGDIVLIQDADLEYDLDDYERLIAPIRAGQASFVLGSRHSAEEGGGWRIRRFEGASQISDLLNLGHLFFTWFLNAIFMQRLRDPFTMYKVFRRDCIYAMRFECNRFDFDHELVGKLVRNGFSPIELDVNYKSRSFDEGKKVSILGDPPTWIRACLKHRFSKLRDWPIAAPYIASSSAGSD
ncbi:MAG TPA: glycosyltransferase family 2 protein [Methylovirgula sp.]|nr:glycosyltransferase family 2 protein [Methylovirgula sp.]